MAFLVIWNDMQDVGCQRPRHLRGFRVNPRFHSRPIPGGKVSRSVSCRERSAEKSALQSGSEVSCSGVECTSLRHYTRLSVLCAFIYPYTDTAQHLPANVFI